MKKLFITLCALLPFFAMAETYPSVTYKQLKEGKNLQMEIVKPSTQPGKQGYTTVVFFFGGGWNGGTINQFKPQAERLKELGVQSMLVNYRTKTSHGTSPKECVMDAKSAMRYIKANARKLNVNVNRLVTSGGSAGGHLAAATCYIKGFNDPADDLSIDPRPTAMILYNPVVDNSEKGYGYDRVKDYYKEFSPYHNINQPVPTIFFVGSKDPLIPPATAKRYKKICESKGGKCELHIYEGREHGFFNQNKGDGKDFEDTTNKAIQFLKNIGYIQ